MILLKHIQRVALILSVAFLFACGDESPAAIAKEIDDLMAKNLPMSAEQKAEFNQANENGRAALEAGNNAESAQQLKKALAVLRKAEDAAMFNKSE